jgi:hypothetical protein
MHESRPRRRRSSQVSIMTQWLLRGMLAACMLRAWTMQHVRARLDGLGSWCSPWSAAKLTVLLAA